MRIKLFFIICLMAVLLPVSASGQTPIANRVKARAAHLKSNETAIAKYTDDRRHCLFFVRSSRIFKYDAVSGSTSEIVFCQDGYDTIMKTWISKDGGIMFVLVDRSSLTTQPLVDKQEICSLNSFTGKTGKIASGFSFGIKKDGSFYLTHQVDVRKNAHGRYDHIVEDQWFYDDGRPLWVKDRRLWKNK